MLKVFCFIRLHFWRKIDKNQNHDFLVCTSCGKRKFRFKSNFYQNHCWKQGRDFSKKPIIEAWINGASYEETKQKLFN
jgi:hypothetical protein